MSGPVVHAARPSRNLRLACAALGVEVRAGVRRSRHHAAIGAAARRIERLAHPGMIIFITGPSGSGKSTLLRLLARRMRARAVTSAPRSPRSTLDAAARVCGSWDAALALLNRAGLGEPRVLAAPCRALSEGQRHRLAIALAMARARPGGALVVDELGSTLDRAAALGVAAMLVRWARARRVRLFAATAHDDVLEALAPHVLVVLDSAGRAEIAAR